MKILEVKPRRRHLSGIVFDEHVDPKELGAEVDPVGLVALDSELCESERLQAGTELDEERLQRLIEQSYIKRAKSRAMWYLSRQDMPKEKLRRKLLQSFPDYAASAAADRAVELGFINDLEYAKRRLQLIIDSKKVSLKAAARILLEEGVGREEVELAVEEAEYDPQNAILTLIDRKYKSKLQSENGYEKVVAALQRKGYSYSEIRTALKSFEDEWTEF